MSIPKQQVLLVHFTNVNLHLQNQSQILSQSRDVNDWRIFDSDWLRAFWLNSRTTTFPDEWFQSNIKGLYIITFILDHFQTKLMAWFSSKPKNPVLSRFWRIFCSIFLRILIFPNNRALPPFSPYDSAFTHSI